MAIDFTRPGDSNRRWPFLARLGEVLSRRHEGPKPRLEPTPDPTPLERTRAHPEPRTLPTSTAEMDTVFDSSPIGIIFKDKLNHIEHANAAFARAVGCTQTELKQMSMRTLFPADADRLYQDDLQIMASAEPKRNQVESVTLPSGEKLWLRVDKHPRYDEHGRLVGIIVFGLNITEQLQAQQSLATLIAKEHAARLEAERLSRIKDEFLITLSHELRTPLTPIIGWTELLLSGDTSDQELPNILQTIRRNAKSELHLIDNLLDTANIMSGGLRLELATVDLLRLARDVCELAKPSADARKLQFQLQLQVASCQVWGDAQRLHQMLEHIVANAIKFTPPGGAVTVTVGCAGSSATLSIVDTGVGIRPEYLPYIFDRFSQGDGSNTRSYAGLGIGLTLVRHIVEAHHSTIAVASAGDRCGTSFVITIPLQASDEASVAAANVPPSPSPATLPMPSTTRSALRPAKKSVDLSAAQPTKHAAARGTDRSVERSAE